MKKLLLLFSIGLLSSCGILTGTFHKKQSIDATTLTVAQQDSLMTAIINRNWEKHVINKNKEHLFENVTLYVDTNSTK